MDAAMFMRLLEATMQQDNAIRKDAESKLSQLLEAPGYLHALVSILAMPAAAVEVRMAAALALKRACMHWEDEDAPERQAKLRARLGRICLFSDADKQQVRSVFVQLTVAQTDRPIVNALSDTLRLIIKTDFPHAWPDLVASLLTALSGGHPPTVLTCLALVHAMVKQYEMEGWTKEQEEKLGRSPGDIASEQLVGPLLTVGQALSAGPTADEAGRALSLVLKSYFRMVHYRLGRYRAVGQPASVKAWVELAAAVLGKPLPPGPASADPDAPWHHAKKWAANILARLTKTWSDPTHANVKDRPDAKACAKLLKTTLTPHIVVPAALTALKAAVDGSASQPHPTGFLSSKTIHALLEAVNGAMDTKQGRATLNPYLPWLAGEALPWVLALNAEEVEAVEEDPLSWLQADEEVAIISWADPRHAADVVLHDLMITKASRAIVQPVLEGFIGKALGAAAAASTPAAKAAALPGKEVALRMLSLLSNNWRYSKAHRGQLPALLAAHVTPELQPGAAPILRVRSIRTWMSFMDSSAIPDDMKGNIALTFLNLLQDRNEAVRIVAADAVSEALGCCPAARDAIRPHVTVLLQGLFGMMDSLGHEALTSLIQRLIDVYVGDTPALSGPLAAKLTALFLPLMDKLRALGPGDEDDDDYTGGGGDDEDDPEVLNGTAGSIMEALLILMEQLVWWKPPGQEDDEDDDEEDEEETGAAGGAGRKGGAGSRPGRSKPKVPPMAPELAAAEKAGRLKIVKEAVIPEVWRVLDSVLAPSGDLAAALGRPREGEVWIDLIDVSCALMATAVQALGEEAAGCEAAWALLPRLVDASFGNARNWMEEMCAPLDALVDFGRARLAAAGAPPAVPPGTPPALAQAADPVACYVRMANGVETECDDDDRLLASRIGVSALWHVWRTPGGMRLVQGLVGVYGPAMYADRTRTDKAKALCLAVVAMALQVSPHGTLATLQSVLPQCGPPGRTVLDVLKDVLLGMTKLDRLTDVKCCVHACGELLRAATEDPALAESLRPILPGVLAVAVEMVAKEDGLRMAAAAKAAKDKADAVKEEAERDDEVGSEDGAEQGLLDAQEDEEDEDDDDEEGEGEEEEDDWGRREDGPDAATPMDHVNSKLYMAGIVAGLGKMPGAAQLQAALPPAALPQLASLMQMATQLQAEGKAAGVLGPLPVDPELD